MSTLDKHTCTHAKAITNNKIQKHHKPTGISELLGAKQGTAYDFDTRHLQDGGQTTQVTPVAQTTKPPLPSPYLRNQSAHLK